MRKRVRVVALVAVAVLLAVVLGLGAITWITRTSGPSVRVASDEGGVAVHVPRGWSVAVKHPTTFAQAEFLDGHEDAALGFLQRGGFWVSR